MKRAFLPAIVFALMLIPSVALAQGGPSADSPRGQAIQHLRALLNAEEDGLEAAIEEHIAPSLIEELGDELGAWVADVRHQLDGFSVSGFLPVGPTTVGATHEGAMGAVDLEFSVEEEKPHRLTAITLSGGASEEGNSTPQ